MEKIDLSKETVGTRFKTKDGHEGWISGIYDSKRHGVRYTMVLHPERNGLIDLAIYDKNGRRTDFDDEGYDLLMRIEDGKD